MSENSALPNLSLPHSRTAWNTPGFDTVFRQEVGQLDPALLPLQQGLSGTSSVADAPFTVLLLAAAQAGNSLRVKAGILYAGITGGCSCADDPTPLEAQPEYCELWFDIDLHSGDAVVRLATDA
jgi:hypothetical protein